MKGGDISNTVAPAIMIDIEDLIVEFPQNLGTKKKILPKKVFSSDRFGFKIIDEAVLNLEKFYLDEDINVYLFAHLDPKFEDTIFSLLEDIPCNKIYVGNSTKREMVLRFQNIHWYYYKKEKNAPKIINRSKGVWVRDYTEITF